MDEKRALAKVEGVGELAIPRGLAAIAGAWVAELEARTGSKRTPAEYARILARFLSTVPGGDPGKAAAAHVQAFAYGAGPEGDHRAADKPSASTVTVRLAALRSFYDFARRMGAAADDPTANVKRPKKAEATARGFSPEELRALLAAIPDSPSGKRDRAAILTGVLVGLRRRELLGLTLGDLSRNGRVYVTWRAKGGKVRRRELPAPAFKATIDAVKARGEKLEDMDPADKLFPVSGSGFAANLRRYCDKAGLPAASVHVLRHTAAKLRRDAGATIEEVSGFLGHADLATTSRYLKRLEGEEDSGWAAVWGLLQLPT